MNGIRRNCGILFRGALALIFFLLTTSFANAKILVVSPHPDDDAVMASGIISKAVARGEEVRVIFVTNGDYASATYNGTYYNGLATGLIRESEAVSGQNNLGVAENNLMFLGYPDGYLQTIYTNPPTTTYTTPNNNQSITYGNRGLGLTDYHNYRFGSHAGYSRANILADLEDILSAYQPDDIIVPSEFDNHPDHATTYQFIRLAVINVSGRISGFVPIIHKTIVWWGSNSNWPNLPDPRAYFTAIPDLSSTGLVWSNRESIDVPLSMQATQYSLNPKALALDEHRIGQHGTYGIIGRFLHKDEFFWAENVVGANQPPIVNAGLDQTLAQSQVAGSIQLDGSQSRDPQNSALTFQWTQIEGPLVQLSDATSATPSFTLPANLTQNTVFSFELVVSDGQFTSFPDSVSINVLTVQPAATNIAPLATVTASAESTAYGQGAVKAVDGFLDGYPVDGTHEWAANGQKAGTWIHLAWAAPYSIDRIVLYDRPNLDDNIVSATIAFSDGSTLQTGALNWNGTAVEFRFPARVISSLNMTITSVSATTWETGLAEIQVYGNPAGTSQYALALSAAPAGSGAIAATPSSASYYAGQQVTLTATPASGYVFSGWSGGATGTATPLTITMNSNMAITANFAAVPGVLTVTPSGALNASGPAGGPFSPASAQYTLTNTGNSQISWSAAANQTWVGLSATGGNLAPNTSTTVTVSISAAAASLPEATYSDTVSFANLTNGNGTTTRSVSLVIANAPQTHTLSLEANPLGFGSITANPSRSSYATGEQVTLTAVPAVGYAFSNWSGDATGTTNPLTATINSNMVVVANFVAAAGSLSVTPADALNASGSVGGPFTPASMNYTLQNTGNSQINWSASATQSWVGLSVNSGTLAPGATTAVTASINSSAVNLAAGSYNDTISFVNLTNGNGSASRPISLAVTNAQTTNNIASAASVTASSEATQYGQTALKAVDGVADGYPGDYTREWATNGQATGAWIRLNWSIPYSVSRIVLFDRPNSDDNISGATLSFSDGSSLTIGPLANNGAATEYTFPARVITSLTMTVTATSSRTQNAGLSEIQVFGIPANGSQYNLLVAAAPSGSGSVSINPSSSSYYAGQQVILTAAPAVGYAFSGWNGSVTATANPLTVTMNSDMALTANFTPVPGSLEITPSGTLNASGSIGGPFTPADAIYTLRNTGNTQIDWSADVNQSWVSLSLIGGTLAPGATAAVTVSINSAASSLTAGTYNGAVSFENLTNSIGNASRAMSLTITDPAQLPTNIAPAASVTASSEATQYGQTAIKAVDGVADGYPGDYTREWATNGQGVGAWLRLNWSTPHTVSRIVLFDRPNSDDNITNATISFSDGSTLTVGPLANNGGATEYTFTARSITSLTMTVTTVSSRTLNTGLAEIQVFGN